MSGAVGRFVRAPFHTMGQFMLWLSTANLRVLERFPSDRPKYVGLGSAVFITSSMAAISSGFALRMGLNLPIPACAVLGLLWGLAIMGFDRWLLATAGRSNIWMLLPRAALAFLIGLVVSTPFVLRIFQPEIMQQVALIQASAATSQQESWNDPRNPIVSQINRLSGDIGRQTVLVNTKGGATVENDPAVSSLVAKLSPDVDPMKTYNRLQQQINCEESGSTNCGDGVGSGRPGDGFRTQQLKQQRDDYFQNFVQPLQTQLAAARTTAGNALPARQQKAVQDAKDQIAADQKELAPLLVKRDRLRRSFDTSNTENTGLLIRMQALGDLTKHNATMRTTHYTLLAFITAIDCLPILFKLFMLLGRKNKYEEGLEAEEREHLAISRQFSRRLRAEQTIYQTDTLREAQAARDERDEAIEELARRTVRDQVEIAERTLDRWKREEFDRVDQDPNYRTTRQVPAPNVLPAYQRSASVDEVLGAPPQRSWPPTGRSRDELRRARRGPERPTSGRDVDAGRSTSGRGADTASWDLVNGRRTASGHDVVPDRDRDRDGRGRSGDAGQGTTVSDRRAQDAEPSRHQDSPGRYERSSASSVLGFSDPTWQDADEATVIPSRSPSDPLFEQPVGRGPAVGEPTDGSRAYAGGVAANGHAEPAAAVNGATAHGGDAHGGGTQDGPSYGGSAYGGRANSSHASGSAVYGAAEDDTVHGAARDGAVDETVLIPPPGEEPGSDLW
ncbi:DUF4407 domain-containing protein [Frankia sp. AiPa1]|uniref:DUF4407 domain-containing protein n=1 Tax=Frankia sp. AiPa1 TaxID=573492 RepID=UPI00202B080A|nr:DUF4407 domain-containing protein [Frankia sp. AiPa1]MCL9760494.1 DUF4407 domain-containing protein [Frankia sp. AiPa1]